MLRVGLAAVLGDGAHPPPTTSGLGDKHTPDASAVDMAAAAVAAANRTELPRSFRLRSDVRQGAGAAPTLVGETEPPLGDPTPQDSIVLAPRMDALMGRLVFDVSWETGAEAATTAARRGGVTQAAAAALAPSADVSATRAKATTMPPESPWEVLEREFRADLTSSNHRNYYFECPTPKHGVSLLKRDGDVVHLPAGRAFVDNGSEAELMDRQWADANGIPWRPMDMAVIGATNEHSSRIVGFTEPLEVVLAPGTGLEKVTKATFMVVEGSSPLYTVLPGSRVQGRLASWVNPLKMSFDYCLNPSRPDLTVSLPMAHANRNGSPAGALVVAAATAATLTPHERRRFRGDPTC
jgi:hypothetical protein